MKTLLAFLLLTVGALAQIPDPRDSVIIESKIVPPFSVPCGSSGLQVRIWIVNRDTLKNVFLPLETRSLTGLAYGLLSRPANCSSNRTFPDIFNVLLPSTQLPNRAVVLSNNDISPDHFRAELGFDSASNFSKLPPHFTSTPMLDLKFDSAFGNGQFQIDSIALPFGNNIRFINSAGTIVKPFFVKGMVTVGYPPPHPADSIILESKAIVPFSGPCGSVGMQVRIWITNRDTLRAISLPLETKSLSGAAYGLLSRPADCSSNRAFPDLFNFLLPSGQLPNRTVGLSGYDGVSPDNFPTNLGFDSTNNLTKTPPHATRTPLMDLKFESASGDGQFQIDSMILPLANHIRFVNAAGATVKPFFVKSMVRVVGSGPHPADSIILESKQLYPASGPCGSPVMRMRIWIVNKDSLTGISLPLISRASSGSARAILSRPADCGDRTLVSHTFDFLYPSAPGGAQRLAARTADYGSYHSNLPDTFKFAFEINNPGDGDEKIPPNLARILLGELKFDSASGAGRIFIDSVNMPNSTVQFLNTAGSIVPVNFFRGGIIVNVPPHPADSIIVESKIVHPLSGPCQSAGLKVRVWVTNKDSIANISLYLETKSRSGGAYATLSRPGSCGNHTFSAVFDPLLPSDQLKSRFVNTNSSYHSNPPDSFAVLFTLSDPTDDLEKFPPHLTRTPIGDIKFDTVFANIGEFEIDSGKVLAGTIQMVNLSGVKVKVNFVKSIITVTCDTPPGTPTLNCPASPINFTHGDPFSFDFNSSAAKPYFSIIQGPGSIDPAFGLYSLPDLCPPSPVSVRVRVIDSVGLACFSPPVFCDFSFVVGNNAPFVTNCPDSIFSISPGIPFSLQLAAADPDAVDADSLTFSLTTGPPGLSVSPSGLVQWTPAPEQSGAFYACVQITDPCGASSKCCLNFNGRKGDLNLDGILNSSDVVLMLNCVFLGIDPPAGQPSCDVNCTGVATPLDVIYQINAVFSFWSYPCP